jgi:hypothetical protein
MRSGKEYHESEVSTMYKIFKGFESLDNKQEEQSGIGLVVWKSFSYSWMRHKVARVKKTLKGCKPSFDF